MSAARNVPQATAHLARIDGDAGLRELAEATEKHKTPLDACRALYGPDGIGLGEAS